MRTLIVLPVLLAACGFSDDELGLIASAVLHSVEQARADVEGLDLNYFGLSDLVNLTSDGFDVSGRVANSCGGESQASGSGKRGSGKLDYQITLELDGWASCSESVQVTGTVSAQVTADEVSVSDLRQRPATTHVTGKVRALGDGITSDNRDVLVGFHLTMVTGPGLAEPEVSGDIEGVDL